MHSSEQVCIMYVCSTIYIIHRYVEFKRHKWKDVLDFRWLDSFSELEYYSDMPLGFQIRLGK